MRFVNVHRVLLIHVFVPLIILYAVLPCTTLFRANKYYSPLGRNLRVCCRRFGWQLEDFLLGFVSFNDDCFHNFCMNNTIMNNIAACIELWRRITSIKQFSLYTFSFFAL